MMKIPGLHCLERFCSLQPSRGVPACLVLLVLLLVVGFGDLRTSSWQVQAFSSACCSSHSSPCRVCWLTRGHKFAKSRIVRLQQPQLFALKDDDDEASSSTLATTTKKTTHAQPKSKAKAARTLTSKQQPSRRRQQRSNLNNKRINQRIVQCSNAQQVLGILQEETGTLTQPAAGGVLNSVNFSTAVHRLARHSVGQPSQRATVLADPRFALFLASLAEALFISINNSKEKSRSDKYIVFGGRELSNICWSLSKLKLPPPTNVMGASSSPVDAMNEKALQLRQAVLTAAVERRQKGKASSGWIPLLSQLSGHILDTIGRAAIDTISNSRRPFEMQELANLLYAWATAGRADPLVFETIVQQMIRQHGDVITADSCPQEFSNSIYAMAIAQAYQGHEDLLDFVAHLLETYPEFCDEFKCNEMSNTVWGVATLLSNNPGVLTDREQAAALSIVRSAAQYVLRRGTDAFKSQELSNFLWSLATLGFGLNKSVQQSLNNNYLVLDSDNPQGDKELMHAALKEIIHAANKLLPRSKSQELNNLAWSLARLVDKKTTAIEELLDGIGRQLANPRRQMSSRDIGMTLWAFATLEYVNEDLYHRLASRFVPKDAHKYAPQNISNCLWALATAEINVRDRDAFDIFLVPERKRPPVRDPVTRCFAMAARELMRRPHQFKPQEIKDVLWSYSKIRIRHPALFRSVAKHLVGESNNDPTARGMDEFSPQGLGNMAYSYARQAQLAEEVGDRLKNDCNLANTNGRLAVYTTSCIDIGDTLLQRLFAAIAEADLRVHNKLKRGSCQDLANKVYAYAVLGLKETDYMETTKKEVADRLARFVRGEVNAKTSFKGQEISNLFWSLATLNVPAGYLLHDLAPFIRAVCQDQKGGVTVSGIAKFFRRQELGNLAWACAVFGEYPIDLMVMLYTGLVGSGKEHSPSVMSKVHGDGGLQSQAIMTLIYVQAALDLAGSPQKVFLPDNFPDGWQIAPSLDNEHMTETFDELSLNTSKMQRAVSDAFSRIGFDHVEEHVITMEEMSREHGINVAPKAIPILSIDIANIQDRIAIEVDGPAHFASRIDQLSGSNDGHAKFVNNGKLEYQFVWNGDRQEINGPTALKQRLLNSLGWKVIHLPFWEWQELKGDEVAEEVYCRSLLTQSKL